MSLFSPLLVFVFKPTIAVVSIHTPNVSILENTLPQFLLFLSRLSIASYYATTLNYAMFVKAKYFVKNGLKKKRNPPVLFAAGPCAEGESASLEDFNSERKDSTNAGPTANSFTDGLPIKVDYSLDNGQPFTPMTIRLQTDQVNVFKVKYFYPELGEDAPFTKVGSDGMDDYFLCQCLQ